MREYWCHEELIYQGYNRRKTCGTKQEFAPRKHCGSRDHFANSPTIAQALILFMIAAGESCRQVIFGPQPVSAKSCAADSSNLPTRLCLKYFWGAGTNSRPMFPGLMAYCRHVYGSEWGLVHAVVELLYGFDRASTLSYLSVAQG